MCKLPSNYTSEPLQGCYQSEWVLEIAPFWVSSWVSKLIVVVVKTIKYLVLIYNYGYYKIKYPVLTYDCSSQKKLKKKSKYLPTILGLCWFFHDTQWLFEIFEIPETWQFFEFDFFSKISGANSSLILKFFQIPRTSTSLVLNFFLKNPELKLLSFWIFVSNTPNSWVLRKSHTHPHWLLPMFQRKMRPMKNTLSACMYNT